MSARPLTTILRNTSPRMCTDLGKRWASSSATVDLPDAMAPVITVTLPRDVITGLILGAPATNVRDRHPCAAESLRSPDSVGASRGPMIRTSRNYGSITNQGVRAHGASACACQATRAGGVAVGL